MFQLGDIHVGCYFGIPKPEFLLGFNLELPEWPYPNAQSTYIQNH